ncbi:MAG: hypothetical protein IKQ08_08545 [Paludibacteraceae bacterium]|nr:hypothetical protein [Paludibacteraceae bacterium]
MVEYFFYGTKGGLTTLSSKTDRFTQPFDIRNNVQAMDLLGKCFYSLSFIPEGCIFSKYTFVLDTPRSNGFGFLGVDVFVPSSKRVQSINELLDELIGGYVSSYVKDNGINNNEAEIKAKEDFYFADNLLSKYAESGRSVEEQSFSSGAKTPSFYLYKSSDELKALLDEPYRAEYKDYKRVFLIDSKDQGILKVIKYDSNSDLTGRVDLKNLLYKVEECSTSKCDKKILHRNDSLSITWKEEFCDSKTESGSLNDLISKKVIELDEENRVVKILTKTLSKTTKDIRVSVVDYNGRSVKNATLTYNNRFKGDKISISGNIIRLEGENVEHVNDFQVYVEGLDPEYKVEKNGYPLKNPETTITLHKEKKVSVSFVTPEITLKDRDTENPRVEVSAKIGDENYYYQGSFSDKPIKLVKQSGSTYSVPGRKNGTEDQKKESRNEGKKVGMQWLIVSVISGFILTIGSFFLADFLDLNIFGSHEKHNGLIEQTTEEPSEPPMPNNGICTTRDPASDTIIAKSNEEMVTSTTETHSADALSAKKTSTSNTPALNNNKGGSDNQNQSKVQYLDLEKNELEKKNDNTSKKLCKFWNIEDEIGMEKFKKEIKDDNNLKELYEKINGKDFKKYPKGIESWGKKTINELLNEMR